MAVQRGEVEDEQDKAVLAAVVGEGEGGESGVLRQFSSMFESERVCLFSNALVVGQGLFDGVDRYSHLLLNPAGRVRVWSPKQECADSSVEVGAYGLEAGGRCRSSGGGGAG